MQTPWVYKEIPIGIHMDIGMGWAETVRYLDTYRRYLRNDTSIAKVTIYRGISLQ